MFGPRGHIETIMGYNSSSASSGGFTRGDAEYLEFTKMTYIHSPYPVQINTYLLGNIRHDSHSDSPYLSDSDAEPDACLSS